jgi:alcohol dehydrogenase
MMESSLLAGLAICHTRTGLAHSISYPLTARYGMPHGLACSFTVPAIWKRMKDEGLSRGIADLFLELEVPAHLLKYLRAYENLYPLMPEMITPGRADNMLFPVNPEVVADLLNSTQELLGLGTA